MSKKDREFNCVEQTLASLGVWTLMFDHIMRLYIEMGKGTDLESLRLYVGEKIYTTDGHFVGVVKHRWDWEGVCWESDESLVADGLGEIDHSKSKFYCQFSFYETILTGPDMFPSLESAAKFLFSWDREHKWYPGVEK